MEAYFWVDYKTDALECAVKLFFFVLQEILN